MSSRSDLSTDGHADLIFEVRPDETVFDTIRRSVVRQLESKYNDVVPDDIREHIRIDTVDVEPTTWKIKGKLNSGYNVTFAVQIKRDDDATSTLLDYIRRRIEERYAPNVRPDAITFERVGMRPNAWFVDAKVPPATDGNAKD